jgi:hypothetical protein
MANNKGRKGNNPWSNENKKSETTSKQWLNILQNEENPDSDFKDEDFEIDDPSVSMPNMLPTTSTNPEKPRTVKAGFDYKTFKMIVVFRDGTWWQYNGVPVQMWENFKTAESKGKYLASSGLDSWPDMGEADMASLSKAQKTQINDMKGYLDYIYKGK